MLMNQASFFFKTLLRIVFIVSLVLLGLNPLQAMEPEGFSILPNPVLYQLQRLTDEQGIFEHANLNASNPDHGYCIEDVARALAAVLMFRKSYNSPLTGKLAAIYLQYMELNQNADGSFHHRMDSLGNFSDRLADGDALGRVIWGLGYATAYPVNAASGVRAEAIFRKIPASSILSLASSPRPAAYAIIGLCYFLQHDPEDKPCRQQLLQLTDSLVRQYRTYDSNNWHWFEPLMSYDNGRIPFALLLASEVANVSIYRTIGLKSLDFLIRSTTGRDGFLQVVGNHGWFKKGAIPALFDQQPIDAAAMVEACGVAWQITGDAKYRRQMENSFQWFFGRNIKRVCLYDFSSGGCRDGLGADGANRNQGAESSIMYLIARLSILESLGK